MPFPLQEVEGSSEKILCFDSFGVRVGIISEYLPFLERLAGEIDELLPVGTKHIENKEIEHLFTVYRKGELVGFQKNGGDVSEAAEENNVYNFFLARVRLTVAEFAASHVFVHAGVVSWKDRALVFPGNSFSGKTTLVKEMIGRGAVYFSDEYAILDEKGLVHPFPKTLSLRGIVDQYVQVEHSASEFGAATGTNPLPVGMVLFSEFEENAMWTPKKLSNGEGVLKIISFTLPIRVAPEFSLKVLNNALSGAVICESKRGEAAEIADDLIAYFEENL